MSTQAELDAVIAADVAFADELVSRLNKVVMRKDIRGDIDALFKRKVHASLATLLHPHLIVIGGKKKPMLRVLGFLNGLLGPSVVIAAIYDEEDRLLRFSRIARQKIKAIIPEHG